MSPRFVITGTGRSGTGYIAQVLSVAGIPCGHEAWFNPFNHHDDTIIGDSSWCALALGLDDYDGLVFHQIRHPLDVITSLVRHPIVEPAYLELHRQLIDADPDDTLGYAMTAWLTYTQHAEKHATGTWRLDDITVGLLLDLAEEIGEPMLEQDAAAALATVPRTYNQHHNDARLTWADLLLHDTALTADILTAARQWGYE